jgi:hypothetical protein
VRLLYCSNCESSSRSNGGDQTIDQPAGCREEQRQPSRSMSDRPRLSSDHAIAYQNKAVVYEGGGIALNGKRWLSCQPRFFLGACAAAGVRGSVPGRRHPI